MPQSNPPETPAGSTALVRVRSNSAEAFGRGLPVLDYEAFGRAEAADADREGTNQAKEGQSKNDPTNRQSRNREKSDSRESEEQNDDRNSNRNRKKPENRKNPKDDQRKDQDDSEEPEQSQGKKNSQDEEDDGEEDPKDKKPSGPALYKRPAVLITLVVLLIIIAVAGTLFWLWYRQYQSTDDAYIDGHVTEISPQVAAPVKFLHVDDNQLVKQGDLLVELDSTDFDVALHQAQAQVAAAQGRLEQSRAQIVTAQASVAQTLAEIDAAQVALDNTTRDLARYENVDDRARSQQQLDNALAAKKNAQAQLEQAKARNASAPAGVMTAEASVNSAQGDLQEAAGPELNGRKWNVNYCRIVAGTFTMAGVTHRTAENGTYVTPGQAMFSLVSLQHGILGDRELQRRETQLTLMKPGQAVCTSKSTLFLGKDFEGKVDSIQAGVGGPRFSRAARGENATGNFVKIVQRLPVKIIFNQDANTSDFGLLSPGLSRSGRASKYAD